MNIPKNKRIAVAMSGGYDSTFAAFILKQKGYYIEGFTLKMLDEETESEKSCCSLSSIERAKQICYSLGIKHNTFYISDLFKEKIINDFINKYMQGLTPNPCIKCNRLIKFGYLLKRIRNLGFDYLATGHYAIKNYNIFTKEYCIYKNKDSIKDQSYFLSTLTKDQLKYIIFPLAQYSKSKVREILTKYNILPEKIKESQDVCFLGNYKDYRDFIKSKIDLKTIKEGNFINKDNKILGKHKGIPFYTIGQRRGLNISFTEPLYVKELNPKNNTIIVGTKKELLKESFFIKNINLICKTKNKDIFLVKIRYQFKPRLAEIEFLENGRAKVKFINYKSEITPGQQAVFYKKNKLIGSGEIERN